MNRVLIPLKEKLEAEIASLSEIINAIETKARGLGAQDAEFLKTVRTTLETDLAIMKTAIGDPT